MKKLNNVGEVAIGLLFVGMIWGFIVTKIAETVLAK